MQAIRGERTRGRKEQGGVGEQDERIFGGDSDGKRSNSVKVAKRVKNLPEGGSNRWQGGKTERKIKGGGKRGGGWGTEVVRIAPPQIKE